jgi:phosphoglycolate phosphatase
MSTMFDLVMFDLDGTLVETAPEIHDAVNDTLRRFDLKEVSQQQVDDWIGQGTRELLVQALAHSGGTSAPTVRASDSLGLIAAEFDRHYQRRCGTRSRLYPQVRETLSALRGQGVKLAVVTNKEGRYTQTVLDAHQLAPLLDMVVSGDTLPRKKPDPAGLQSCLARFNVPRHRALFVGDSSIDVATARNAGVAVWALPYGYNMGQPIAACAPDRVIADCSALLNESRTRSI